MFKTSFNISFPVLFDFRYYDGDQEGLFSEAHVVNPHKRESRSKDSKVIFYKAESITGCPAASCNMCNMLRSDTLSGHVQLKHDIHCIEQSNCRTCCKVQYWIQKTHKNIFVKLWMPMWKSAFVIFVALILEDNTVGCSCCGRWMLWNLLCGSEARCKYLHEHPRMFCLLPTTPCGISLNN